MSRTYKDIGIIGPIHQKDDFRHRRELQQITHVAHACVEAGEIAVLNRYQRELAAVMRASHARLGGAL